MSRLLSIFAGLCGLFMATLLAAQTPPPQTPPAQTPPAQTPPAQTLPAQTPDVRGTPSAPPALAAENTWNLDLSTGGRVVIQLRPDVTPNHVERIKALTRQGFYNGLTFFRVIEGFMAQGGDPQNNGTGGSTLPNVNAEINGLLHVRGAVAMARASDPNSGNSQFYIMFTPRLNMDRNYTVFGRVVSGMNFIDAIERGEPPANPSRIVRASLGTDNLPPMTADELRAAAAQMAAAASAPAGALRGISASGPQVPPPVAGPRRLEPVRGAERPPR